MSMQSEAQRQLLGCGFAPQPDESRRMFVGQWKGGSLPNYKGPTTTVCPGYSTQLPEVIEVVRTHRHWSKGNRQLDDLNAPMTVAVEIFDSAAAEYQSWAMTSVSDGGGRGER
jgi:hypothetical protein